MGPVFVECIGKVIKLCKEFSTCVLEIIFNKVASLLLPQEEPVLCVNQGLKWPIVLQSAWEPLGALPTLGMMKSACEIRF